MHFIHKNNCMSRENLTYVKKLIIALQSKGMVVDTQESCIELRSPTHENDNQLEWNNLDV